MNKRGYCAGRKIVINALQGIGLFVLSLQSPVLSLVSDVEAQDLKVGYVNAAKLFADYQRTKDSEVVLEQKGKQKQGELESRMNELKKMRQGLEPLNDQTKEAKGKELEEKSDEFKRLKARSERELLKDRNDVAKAILDEISQVVTDYAKANGFSLILDERSLLYGEPGRDLTDELLKALNARYAAGKTAAPVKR